MVVDKEPVADLVALAIDRQGLARQGADDHQRDQLFREVIGAVIVGTVGDDHRQAIGMAPGRGQMVRRRLGRRIGRARIIGRVFGEEAFRPQGPEHLVRRDVVKPEPVSPLVLEGAKMLQRRLQHDKGADHIGLNELARPVDRPVNMALGGEMGDDVRIKALDRASDRRSIADIDLQKPITRRVGHRRQIAQGPGIGQLVENQNLMRAVIDQPPHQGRADKARAARNQNLHLSSQFRGDPPIPPRHNTNIANFASSQPGLGAKKNSF